MKTNLEKIWTVIDLANGSSVNVNERWNGFRRRKPFDLLRTRKWSWTDAIVVWPPKGRTELRWWKVN
ncbi:MAG: hypothetical protein ACTS4T_01150 [Candidatus Hodgkinia cicadicola]